MSPERLNLPKETPVREIVRTLLVTADGLVCIGRRARGGYMAGYWCLVGGKAESPDLKREALRETGEELGLPVSEVSDEETPVFAYSTDRQRGSETFRNNYFIQEIDDGKIPDILAGFDRREFAEIAFVGPDDLDGLRFAFGNGKAVRDFFKYVGN